MNDAFDKADEDLEVAEEFHLVLGIAVRKVLDGADAPAFLDWARNAIPQIATGLVAQFPPNERERHAFWLGMSIWNAAPSPRNHYRPVPLPKPGRNQACPCGSGQKFKRCCQRLAPVPDFPPDVFWPEIAEICSMAEIDRMLADTGFPLAGIGLMAEYFLREGKFSQVIKMLEPLLTGRAERIGNDQADWVDMLCDAYDQQYQTPRKKLALLEPLTRHPRKLVQAEAWQRLCLIRIDADDIDGAREAFAAAMRADPDSPMLPMLELTLLGGIGEIEQARQRASFWLRQWEKHEDELPDLVETLREAVSDPLAALQLSVARATGDERIERLERWLTASLERPVGGWEVEACGPLDFDMGDEEPPFWAGREAVTLAAPRRLAGALDAWRDAVDIDKPFATQIGPMGGDTPWDDPDDDAWIAVLEAHPEAIDHLDILDDLVQLLHEHPMSGSVYGADRMIAPLLQRARRIVAATPIGEGRLLPWGFLENRPALRLLAHLVMYHEANGEHAALIELVRWMLELNPADNQGFRCLLINRYLQAGNYADALELAERYPRDFMVDITFGRALALFGLGRGEEAAAALGQAIERSPLVAEYLLRARVARPERDGIGITVGGPDEAWLYRDDMRQTWQGIKGAMKWLKQAGGKPSRR